MLKWLKKKRGREKWPADRVLFRWGDKRCPDLVDLESSFCGLIAFGGTGSGKTSTTLQTVAIAMLMAGYGAIVFSVKREVERWIEFARLTGREQDLRIVDATGKHRFNFLAELAQQGNDAGLVESIVGLIFDVAQIGSRLTAPTSSQGDNEFFNKAAKVLLRVLITLLILANHTLSMADISRLMAALPRSPEEIASQTWRETSLCYRLLKKADERNKSPRELRDFESVLDYVLSDFPKLADRTRSSITATVSGMIDPWQRGLLQELHGADTTLSPRDLEKSAIIIIDLPVLQFGESGLWSQLIWKLMAQRWLQRRPVNRDTVPVLMAIDECQYFAGPTDALFASTCRAFRVCQAMATQSIGGLEAAYGGGATGRAMTDQLLANMGHKVIHALSDSPTAEWASQLCGRSYRMLSQMSSGYDGDGFDAHGREHSGMSLSESLQAEVEPREFSYLRTGGLANNRLVDAIVIRSGRPFETTGRIWKRVTMQQSKN